MTQEALDGQTSEQPNRRGRGSTKPFPATKFEDVLTLPECVSEHGVNGRIRRLTLFDRLGRSPESGPSRQLITDSGKYGLTAGGYTAEYIVITEAGREILESDHPVKDILSKKFDCVIGKFEVFSQVYDKLMGQRVPAEDVLADQFAQAGLSSSDIKPAAGVFVANLRYLGLIRQISGTERVISLDQLLEETPEGNDGSPPETPRPTPVAENAPVAKGNGNAASATNRPALHIDIQVHIDPTSSAEQIDQIFASMAKHLYGNES